MKNKMEKIFKEAANTGGLSNAATDNTVNIILVTSADPIVFAFDEHYFNI